MKAEDEQARQIALRMIEQARLSLDYLQLELSEHSAEFLTENFLSLAKQFNKAASMIKGETDES